MLPLIPTLSALWGLTFHPFAHICLVSGLYLSLLVDVSTMHIGRLFCLYVEVRCGYSRSALFHGGSLDVDDVRA